MNTNRFKVLTHLVTATFSTLCLLGQPIGSRIGGIISGTVVTEQGRVIPAATVILTQSSGVKRQADFSTRDGNFQFTSLPAGRYRLCAKLPVSTLLDPCDWETKPVYYTLLTNQMIERPQFVMKQGVVLPIRVDDPGNLLKDNESKTQGSNVFVGVPLPSGMILPASLTSNKAAAGGRDHQVLIPTDTDVNVIVSSRWFQMSDDSGKPIRMNSNASAQAGPVGFNQTGTASPSFTPVIQNQGSIPLRVASGKAASKLTVRITGVEAK